MSNATPAASKGKGRTLALVGAVVVIVVIALAYFALGGMGGGNNSTVATTPVSIPNGASTSQLNFSPSSVSVVVGTNNMITFTNHDTVAHTITFTTVPSGVTAATISDPSNLQPGASYSVTLTVPGTYHFECTIHPAWMQGSIVVSA